MHGNDALALILLATANQLVTPPELGPLRNHFGEFHRTSGHARARARRNKVEIPVLGCTGENDTAYGAKDPQQILPVGSAHIGSFLASAERSAINFISRG
jgi:hypothetical protein